MILRKTNRFRHLNFVAAMVVVAMIAAACGGDDTSVQEPATTTTTVTPRQPEAPETATSVQKRPADAEAETSVETDAPSITTTTVVEADTGEDASASTEQEIEDAPEPEEEPIEEPELGPDLDSAPDEPVPEQADEDSEQAQPEPEAEPDPEEAPQHEEEPEPQQDLEEDQPVPEQPDEEAEQVAETPTSTVPPQEDAQPEGSEADDIYEATTTAIVAIDDLTERAVVLWESGSAVEACALADEARAVADAHEAAFGNEALSQDDVWGEWLDVLDEWDAACLQALAEPELTDYEVFVAAVQQGQGWTEPDSPPVHPDTPAPSWERGTNQPGVRPADRPRVTAEVQAWTEWCGTYSGCEWLLFHMVWALDYLGASESCVLTNYVDRAVEESQPGVSDHSRSRIKDKYGWHRCATVVDPVQSDGRLLSEHGLTVAERCRAVLPADVKLEFVIKLGLTQDRLPNYERHDNATCDEWGAWVEGRGVLYEEECDRSARLAEEWLEHYIGMPEPYWSPTC